jgi:tetratricopeptide (TPR) repeat protein
MNTIEKNGSMYDLAVSKYKQKKYDEVIKYCQNFLKKKKSAEFLHILGMALFRKENLEKSTYYLNEAIKLQPNNYKYYLDLGDVNRQKKAYQNALENYVEVLKLNPGNEKAYFGSAHIFYILKKFPLALKMSIAALSVSKDNIDYKLFIAKCLDEMNEFNEAIKIYNEILVINSRHKKALLEKGELLRKTFKYDEALEVSKVALNLDVKDINCYLLMSTILRDMKKIDEAIECLNQGLKIKPESPQGLFNKGVMLLGVGQFEKGWKLYESRWKIKEISEKMLITKNPWWKGEEDSNLLIWPEQGIGDEVMFASMFNEIKSNVQKLTIKADARLIPIFERSFINIKFIPTDVIVNDIEFSHHLPMGSLAQFYRKNRINFENKNHAYLKTNNDLDAKLSEYFEKNDEIKYIGISWKSVNPISGLKRSATLEDVIKYIGVKNAVYVNLQYGDVDEEILEAEKKMNIKIINIKEIDNKKNIDGLFSIINNCDEVISIDNSTIHFAGSIGKKTEVLLHESADFRWEINSKSANWYNSVKLTRNIIL